MIAQKCPVCGGRGSVPVSFYNPPFPFQPTTTAGDYDVTCRSCGGKGVFTLGGNTEKYILINGELCRLVEGSPPGAKPLTKDSGLFNIIGIGEQESKG